MNPTYTDRSERVDGRETAFFGIAFAFLTLGAVALWLAPAARAGTWTGAELAAGPLLLLPVWAGCVWWIRRQAGIAVPGRDPLLLPAAFLLVGWGALLVWRLLPSFGMRQTAWLIAGSLVLWAVLRGPDHLEWLRRYRYLWLGSAVLLTGLTLAFGTHPSGGEPRLWLGCCGFFFQPSEVLRLFLIVYLASFLSERLSLAWESAPPSTFAVLAPLLVVWGLSVALVLVQRDLGTGSLFLGILAVMLYVTTGRRSILLFAAAMLVFGGAVGALVLGIVRARLVAWVNPWQDPIGIGYQIIQSTMALASGGLIGQGPGLGSPGFVPAAHTDFIFSTLVEEWGVAGGLAALALLGLVVSRGLRAAYRARDTFRLMLAAGLSVGLGLQTFVILAGVVRLLPLTGITVPFVSYGGSSLVTNFAAIGLLLRISADRGQPTRFRAPLRRIQVGWAVAIAGLALALGWWGLVQSAQLTSRNDNPRRAKAERYSARGTIVDRNALPLASVSGEPGGYVRTYPLGAAAPVVGFDSARYGQAGLEAAMDPLLRGEAGYPHWEIWWHKLLTAAPPAGIDLQLTLDARLQSEVMAALEGHQGAVVAMGAQSGELLALGSSPTFNPANLDDDWAALVQDPNAPLINRVTQASYQPGSMLAPLLFAWASDQESIDLSEMDGEWGKPVRIDGTLLSCARGEAEAVDSAQLALRLSCPGGWGPLAVELGPESTDQWVRAFQFDQGTDVALPSADPWTGSAPSDAEALAAFAVGQGSMTLTPLQVARAYAALLNNGESPRLRLVQAERRPTSSWTAYEAGGEAEPAVGAAAANRTLDALGQGPDVEYVGEAISGSGGERVAWYFAALADDPVRPMLLVVLEGEPGTGAQALGRRLLSSLQASFP